MCWDRLYKSVEFRSVVFSLLLFSFPCLLLLLVTTEMVAVIVNKNIDIDTLNHKKLYSFDKFIANNINNNVDVDIDNMDITK